MALRLARSWYGLVGAVALLMTALHAYEAIGGARFDPPIVAAGLAVGLPALAAAAWVTSYDSVKRAAVWIGIAIVAFAFLLALWRAATSAGMDAVIFVGVPATLALAAAACMAWAHRSAISEPE